MGKLKWITLCVSVTFFNGFGCSGFDEQSSHHVDGGGSAPNGWEYIDPENGEVYIVDRNRQVVTVGGSAEDFISPEKELGDDYDNVGQAVTITHGTLSRVEMEYVVCDATGIATKKTNCGCSVSPGYVLVGGGAEVDWAEPGAMLYESRPADSNNNGPGTTWLAASKAHMADASHTLTCQAVGMRLQDTSYNWIPAATLKSYISYDRITTGSSIAPSGQCNVPAGKFLLGGGARSNWTGNGQLLTESYPNSNTSWFAKAKDHMVFDSATLDVYCIGIAPSIPNFGTIITERTSKAQFVKQWDKTVVVFTEKPPARLAVCPGGQALYGGAGRLLTRMGITPNLAIVASKDHWAPDGGNTRAWVTQFRWY